MNTFPVKRIALTSVLLCLGLSAQAGDAAPSPKPEQAPMPEQPKTQAQPQGLTADFIYKYLAGEVAGQRGNIGGAAAIFYDLAQSSRDPRLAERAAHAAMFSRQPQLALRAVSLWAELEPDSVEARQATAQLLLNNGKLEEARPHVEKLLATESTRAKTFLELNAVLSGHADKEAALKMMQALAAPYPKQAEARLAVAHLALNAGQNALALQEITAAESLRPDWEVAAAVHGEILLRDSPEKALKFFEGYLKKYPNANEIRLAYAKLLVAGKKLDEARAQFVKLAESANKSPEMAMIVGMLAGQLADYPQADKYFKMALDRGYNRPDQIYLYLAESAEKQKHYEEAYAWYAKVQDTNMRFNAHLRAASLKASEGKLDEARAMLHSIPDMSGDQEAAALQVEAALLAQAKREQEAFDVLDRAIKNFPNTPEMIYDYAMLAEKVQRFDVMEKQLRVLIQLQPDFAQAYNALGYTLADRNERLDEAADLVKKALELSPGDHYTMDSMGWVYYRKGMLDEAIDYLRRAYAIEPDPEIAAHLGEVLWQQGKHDEAGKIWDDALRAHPDNEVLLDTIKKFRP
ncbi:MAG: tetratricopeptide repeat protein [Methylobacillus sp.]|jgi:tetratricopeptide (TPR) repeat protein|nr:tetratricopeptide repeat protein [Methylobacillus sp.]